LAKKGIAIWLFSTITLAALVHMIEAIYVLFLNGQMKLFQLYPLINEKLQAIQPTTYFWVSAITTFILWGITCAIAFENPVEAFLNNILSDAKQQSAVEAQMLDGKSELLDVMNETVGMNNVLLGQVKDMVYNVRTEVKEIQPLKEGVEKLKTELNRLKREIKKFEQDFKHPNECPTCGKSILPEFKVCPYCGANIKLLPETVIALNAYK